jgi:hypothetical protein
MMVSAAAPLFASCDPIGDICFNCMEATANAPMPQVDAARLRLIHGGTLPARATNVYYAEQCGIDCIQWIRFDLPDAGWDEFAVQMRDSAPNLVHSPVSNAAMGDAVPWFNARPGLPLENYALMGRQGWPVSITAYQLPDGVMRVYLVANQM